jgi:hypothetical protein
MNRIALLASTLVLASTALASAAGYDGRWSVSVVTRSGGCDSYRWNVGIAGGKVTDVEGQKGGSAGGIAGNGSVNIRLTSGSDTLTATGKASGAAASGAWASPSRGCKGTWTAGRV